MSLIATLLSASLFGAAILAVLAVDLRRHGRAVTWSGLAQAPLAIWGSSVDAARLAVAGGGLRHAAMFFFASCRQRLRHGEFGRYLAHSSLVPGWARDTEAAELMRVCHALPPDAAIVEIGSFLGASAICLAGARALCGSGIVHCVDPFDGSGDVHSEPIYRALASRETRPLRARFEENLCRAGVTQWIRVHEGTAESVAATWSARIDLLFLDGDQSPAGARTAYDCWVPFLRPGGILAVHNSAERIYAKDHDGMRRLVEDSVRSPDYQDIRLVWTTTFARRIAENECR